MEASVDEMLRVLGHPNRLELLKLLRHERTLDEIRLTPTVVTGGSPDRAISRQAVQNHLDQMESLGLVTSRTIERPGRRPAKAYRVHHARLFAVVEELRELARMPVDRDVDPYETIQFVPSSPSRWDEGPKLVLVHGVNEGSTFPLYSKDIKGDRGWIIGRAADAQVHLSFDPHVSLENAEILRTKEGYRLLDLRSATNGTFLNWRRLPTGGEVPLRSGDVIGVGRSLLVFRTE